MRKYLPVAVFAAVALVSLVLAGYAYIANEDAAEIQFGAAADEAVNRIESRVELQISLLRSTQAMFETAAGRVSRTTFKRFYDAFDIDRNYAGLRGMGFLRVVRDEGQLGAAQDEIHASFGSQSGVHPLAVDAPMRTPIVLYEPLTETNVSGMGYDMYSEAARQPVIDRALETDVPTATGLLTLGHANGNPYPGFLVFQRLDVPGAAGASGTAMLFLVFRGADIFNAALARGSLLPLSMEVYDGAPTDGHLLYRSQTPPADGGPGPATRKVDIAGAEWTLVFRPSTAFVPPSSQAIPLVVGLFGLLLAGAVALIARYQSRAYDAMAALQETAERALSEKDLLLQEMKHRIKNSIARILAIARQTAAGASDVGDFSASFASRLQAMAASQELLTRSRWQKADVGELLKTELGQVFGAELPADMLTGPKVMLDEAATQALGLTFHELATNAMKYGDITGLRVSWRVERQAQERRLHLNWREGGQAVSQPQRVGFGTRLIDMNITRELRGTIEREFGANGLTVTIAVPIERVRARDK